VDADISTEEYDDIEVWTEDDEFVGISVPDPETLLTKEEALELIAALQSCVDELKDPD
jgi:hypothetical protein